MKIHTEIGQMRFLATLAKVMVDLPRAMLIVRERLPLYRKRIQSVARGLMVINDGSCYAFNVSEQVVSLEKTCHLRVHHATPV